MANWKKVVVSGSSPEFSNLQVDGLTADQVVIGGGSAGNLSTTAINGTGNIVATTAASGLEHSGSFSGSFEGSFSGDGTNLTGITAEWDGTMFVGNVSGLASAQITGSGAAPSLILSGSTGNDLVVENDAEIKGNTKLGSVATSIRSSSDKIYMTGFTDLTGSFQMKRHTGNANDIPFEVNSNGYVLINPKGQNYLMTIGTENLYQDQNGDNADLSIKDYDIVSNKSLVLGHQKSSTWGKALTITGSSNFLGSLGVNGNTTVTGSLNLTGSFTGTSDWAEGYTFGFDQTDQNIKFEYGSINLNNHSNGQSGLQMRNESNNLLVELQNNANGGLFSIRGASGANSIVLGGVNGSYHNPNLHLGATSLQSDAKLKVTGNILATTGITSSNLTNDNLLVAGTNGEIESSGVTFNGSALDLGSSNITTTGNGTFGGDVTISGDLAVAGTASFTHASNLDVADKYILLNSGSTGTSDSGGIVIQGPSQDIGDLFGYRSGSAKSDTVQRWGIASGFDAKTSADFTPSAFMAAVVVGTGDDPAVAGANYAQAGNMYIDTDAGYDGIWIYS